MTGQLAYILTLFAVSTYAASIDKCHLESIDTCGEPLRDFRKEIGQKFPTTEDHVDKLCTQLDKADSCIKKFKSQCMTPMQVEMMDLMTEGAYEVFNEFCTVDSQMRNDYLKHAQCMNDAYESDEYKGLVTYVEAALEEMLEKPQNERLPAACCGYQWLEKKSQKLGTEKCGEEAVEAFHRVATMAASNLPEVMCQGFEPESEMCVSSLPKAGAKPKGTIRDSHLAKSFSALYLDE